MFTNQYGLSIILYGKKKSRDDKILWSERKVNSLIYIDINENQFSALVSLIEDEPRICASSRIVKLINAGMFFEASEEFARWGDTARSKTRRNKERLLFLRPALVVHNIGASDG